MIDLFAYGSVRRLMAGTAMAVVLAAPAGPVFGEDSQGTDPAVTNETTASLPLRKFDDTHRLLRTAMADEWAALKPLKAEFYDAKADLKAAQDELAMLEGDNAAAIQAIDDARAAVRAAQMNFDTLSQRLSTAQGELDALIAMRTGTPDPVLEAQITAKEGEVARLDSAKQSAAGELRMALATKTQVETDNARLIHALADAQDKVDSAQVTFDDAKDALVAAKADFKAEKAKVKEIIEQLSPEQIFALNRSLNNALHNKFGVDLDSGDLQFVLDGDFNKRQINAFTKALESEAKFLYLAELTGNDRFLDKAESQKNKFLAKIDRFADEPGTFGKTRHGSVAAATAAGDFKAGAGKKGGATKAAVSDAARDAVKEAALAARDAISGAARDGARQAVKEAALAARDAIRDAAKDAAQQAAKGAAKQAAKAAAKQAAKDAATQAAKGAAKQAARDAAKQAAKDAAKQAAMDAARQAAKDAIKQAVKDQAKAAARGGKKS